MEKFQMSIYDAAIYQKAISMNMPGMTARIIVAQARFETNDYSNKAFLKNNNAFGYKTYKGSNWQSGAGNVSTEGDTYAHYDNIQNSTGELVSWLNRRIKENKFSLALLLSPKCYAHALKSCGYYGGKESDYATGLANNLAEIEWQTVISMHEMFNNN